MPRPSSSFVPKYCKHRASGQAVVTIQAGTITSVPTAPRPVDLNMIG